MKYYINLLVLSFILNISCNSGETSNGNDQNSNEEVSIPDDDETIDEEPETGEPGEENEEKIYGNITWKNWYLSVPTNDGTSDATSIFYEDVIESNFTSEESKYFNQNEDGSFSLFTEFTGFTTSGLYNLNEGRYCRTELREYWKGIQSTDDNWYMDEGTHILESTLKVVSCEGDEDCIVAQIHGKQSPTADGSPATIKIRWRSGNIVVDYYRALTGSTTTTVWTSANDNKITIDNVGNEIFTVQLKIENGVFYFGLICEANNINTGYTEIYDYKSNGYSYDNYFKTGNYFIWDKNLTDSSEVILYNVVTEHN